MEIGKTRIALKLKNITETNINTEAKIRADEIVNVITNGNLVLDAQKGYTSRQIYSSESCELMGKIRDIFVSRNPRRKCEYDGVEIIQNSTSYNANTAKCGLELNWGS